MKNAELKTVDKSASSVSFADRVRDVVHAQSGRFAILRTQEATMALKLRKPNLQKQSVNKNMSYVLSGGASSQDSESTVFTDLIVPGGGRVRVLNKAVFDKAIGKSSVSLRAFEKEIKKNGTGFKKR